MNLQSIQQQLERFKKFHFEEEPHIYWWLNENMPKYAQYTQAQHSMTQLIHKYTNPFDAEKIAPFSAKKLGMTTQAVLDMWQFENKVSTTKGTYIHKYMEYKWLGKPTYHYPPEDVIAIFGYDVLADKWPKLTAIADKFYEDYKDRIIPVGLELVVGDEYYSLCGSVDFLAYDKQTDSLIILDYKSNKEIKTTNKYNQYMLNELKHLDDINYIHYSLQLNGYQHIIEKNTDLRLHNTHFLVWINENNDDYVIYTTKDLKNEAIQMIQNSIGESYGY